MTHYVTEYGVLGDSQVEHIWRRMFTKGLWRSLCGKLSDGTRIKRIDNGTACPLCSDIQRMLYEEFQYEVNHA